MPELSTAREERLFEEWKSEFYLERGRRSSEGMLQRVKVGWFSGPVPLGYLNADTSTERCIEVDDTRRSLINGAFMRVLIGDSLRQNLQISTQLGLLTRDGKPLSLSSFHQMLTNPFYCGMIRYKGELYPGKHEPIVSKEIFEAVQRKLKYKKL